MATADDYAGWIVNNADKKGTPEFNTVAAAYREALAEEQPKAEVKPVAPAPAPKAEAPKKTAPVDGAYGAMGEGIEPDLVHQKYLPSVMNAGPDRATLKPGTPPIDQGPVRPEVRKALRGKFDSADPLTRGNMLANQGVVGDIARQREDELKRFDKVRKAAPESRSLEKVSPDVNDRTQRLIEAGEKPEFARVAAEEASAAGVEPGSEIKFMENQGTVGNTDFDFAMADAYRNAPTVVRAGVAGAEGMYQGGLGLMQSFADATGDEERAYNISQAYKKSRAGVASMGENPSYAGRMFEGAVSSIAQQLPGLLIGTLTGSQGVVLSSMFAQTFGQEYAEGRSKGLDGSDAFARAGLFASFEVLGESFGLKFAMDNIRRAASGMKTSELKEFLGNALKQELPGEYLTSSGQFLTDWSSIGLNKTATVGDYLQQMADTTVQTLMQSGLMTGGTKAVGKATEVLGKGKESGAEQLTRLDQELSDAGRPTIPLEATRNTKLEVEKGQEDRPPLTAMEATRNEAIEGAPTPPAPSAAPVVDPNMEALVKSYTDQGYMEDDARRLAEMSLSALKPTARDTRVLERDEGEAQTLEDRANRALLQAEDSNVPSTEPPSYVTEPSTGEQRAGLPSESREGTTGRPTSPIERGLDAARNLIGSAIGREEQQRASLDAHYQRTADNLAKAFNMQAFPNLAPIFGAEWMQRTMASNPTPEEFQEAAYNQLEELSFLGQRATGTVEPTAAPKVEAAKPVEEKKETAKPVEAWFEGVEKVAVTPHKGKNKLVQMPIDEFLKLAERDAPGSRPDKEARVEKIISEDGKFSEVPYLYIEADSEGNAKVTGHEGRHRARALKALGYATIPVELRSNIRWSEQQDPESFDYKQNWPTTLVGETGDAVPFPVPRDKTYPATKPKETPSVTKTTEAKQAKEERPKAPVAKPAAPTIAKVKFRAPTKTEIDTDRTTAALNFSNGASALFSAIDGDVIIKGTDGKEVGTVRYYDSRKGAIRDVEGFPESIPESLRQPLLDYNIAAYTDSKQRTEESGAAKKAAQDKITKAVQKLNEEPTVDTTESLELLAGRNEALEVEQEDRALLNIDEHLKKVYGTTATGELRKRAPGAGPKVSGTAKTKEQENKESKEYNQTNRDIQVLIDAADRYTPIPEHLQDGSQEQREKGRTGMYPTEAEYDYAEAVRIQRLEGFQTRLYKLAQVRSSQKGYVAAKTYINSLPKVQRERAKALWEGTAKPTVLPPAPKATLTRAQLIRFRKGEDPLSKRGRPKKEKVAPVVVEPPAFKTAESYKPPTRTPEEFEAELKGSSYADDIGSSAPNLSLNAMVKTMVEQGTLSEREAEAISEEIERSKNDEDNFLDDIEDGDLDYEDARNMSLPELTALTKLAAEIAGSEHTHDEDPVFLQLKTLPAALGYIAQTGTPLDVGIAEALLTGENRRLVDATKLIVVKASAVHPANSVSEFYQDAMNGSTGMTVPSPDRTKATVLLAHPDYGHQGINNRTVLHEGIHAVTIAKLFYVEQMIGLGRQDEVDSKLLDAYDELRDLQQRALDVYLDLMAKDKVTNELMHFDTVGVFTDIHEFVAYGLTEPAMKALLFTVPGTATKTSGFSNFVNALMKLLGVNSKFKSGMKDFVLGTSRLMTIKTPAAAKMAEAREQANQKAENAVKAMRLTEKEVQAEHAKLRHAKDSKQKLSILGNMAKLSRDPTELGRLLVAKWNRMSLKDMRETGFLKLLPTDELIKRGTELGIGSLNDVTTTIEKMVTFRVKLLKQVDRIGAQWLKLKEQDAENLADVMHFTTLVAIDPTKDTSNKLVNAEWKKLTREAKAVYVAVRDWYANNYKLYGQYLKERVDTIAGDADESKTLMAAIRTILEAGSKLAPYFPLMRYGKYWARVGGAGKKSIFVMFEDSDSRDKFVSDHMAELAAKGDKRSRERMFEDGYLDEGNSLAELVNKLPEHNDTIRDLFATIDNMKSVDADAKNNLKQEVFQMHLNTMPDESFRKQFLHREGTAGFTSDALRNFGNLSHKMINQLGRIKYGPMLRNQVSAARASLKGNPDKPKLGMIVDRIETRVDAEIAPSLEDDWLAPAMQAVTKTAFLWQMTSVKSAVTQLFSLTTHGLPVLWKYHGVGRGTMQALMDTASMGFGLIGKLKTTDDGNLKYEFPSLRNSLANNPLLQKAYDAYIDSQQNQQTRTADLVGRSKIPSSQYGAMAKTIENGMTFFFHKAESMSREIMYIASFKLNYAKLSKDKNLTDEQKFDRAVQNAKGETKEALFNYEQFNTPEAMRPVPLQAVLQYRKFQLFSLTYLLRNGNEMLSSLPAPQRAGAAKAFFGTLGLSGLLAGVRYTFMYGMIMAAIQGAINFFHDEDEEMPLEMLNFKKYFENVWLPEKLGGLGNFVAHGLLDTVSGYDMGSAVSQDFWFRDGPEAPNWKTAWLNIAAGLAGPAGGMVSNWMSAIDDFNKGDHLKAFEKLTPAMFRGIVTDIRYEKEGVRGMGLDPVKDSTKFTQFQYFMQALGYKTAPLAQKLADNFAVRQIIQKVESQRSSLLNSLLRADELGTQKDFNKVLDRVDRFNSMYPDREIEDDQVKAAFKRHEKMLRDTERGLYIPKGYEDLDRLGRQSEKALRKEERK